MSSTVFIWNSVCATVLHLEKQKVGKIGNLELHFMYFGIGFIRPVWKGISNQGTTKGIKQSFPKQSQHQIQSPLLSEFFYIDSGAELFCETRRNDYLHLR